jgi:alpha-amylase
MVSNGTNGAAGSRNTLALKTKTTPRNAEKAMTWTSSKPDVATVSSNGTVTPKKAGRTVVTVKTENGLSAKITVRVIDARSIKFKEDTRKKTIYKKATRCP